MQEPQLYMVIERYRNGDSAPVYRRFREQGRLAPPGLEYVNSWVTTDLGTCYQIMRTADRAKGGAVRGGNAGAHRRAASGKSYSAGSEREHSSGHT